MRDDGRCQIYNFQNKCKGLYSERVFITYEPDKEGLFKLP